MLTVSEKLTLLSLNSEKGSILLSASGILPYGLAGALMYDLIKKRALELDNSHIITKDYTPENKIESAFMEIVRKDKKKKSLNIIRKAGSKIKIRDLILEKLYKKGIVGKEERSFLWIIKYHRYPVINPVHRINIIKEMQGAVSMPKLPDEEMIVLLSIASSCNLINEVFRKGERRDAKKKIKLIAESDKIGSNVQQIANEIAASVAVIAAVSASSAATSSS